MATEPLTWEDGDAVCTSDVESTTEGMVAMEISVVMVAEPEDDEAADGTRPPEDDSINDDEIEDDDENGDSIKDDVNAISTDDDDETISEIMLEGVVGDENKDAMKDEDNWDSAADDDDGSDDDKIGVLTEFRLKVEVG
jgi:hypothetical protein